MKELQGIWDKVVADIRSAIPEREYSLWIIPLRLSAIKEPDVFISAPNKFIAQWASDNYSRVILDAFSGYSKSIEKINITPDRPSGKPPSGRGRGSTPFVSNIRPSFTFSSFVPSRAGSLALAVAKAVAESPGDIYNPLYIYSKKPAGKTHLLHAIGNRLLSRPDIHGPVYVTCREKKSLYSALRSLDPLKISALLLDDMDHLTLSAKEQERIIALIDKLQSRNVQIVFAGKAHPSQIKGMCSALISRLEGGVLCPMGEYDMAARLEILKSRAGGNAGLPEDLLEEISLSSGDIKMSIKNLVKVQTVFSLSGIPLNREKVREALSDIPRPEARPDAGGILAEVCRYFDIALEDIISQRRGRSVIYPRKIAIYLLKTISLFKAREIARIFSFKDPSPVYRTLKDIETGMKNQDVIERDLATLRQAITGNMEPFS